MSYATKSEGMKDFLETAFGTGSAIATGHCVKPPYGCGKPVTGFRDSESRREYEVSGLCQDCQDKFFGRDEED